jgi:molybdopterin-binding protein
MKTSACNVFKGRGKTLVRGAVTSEVVVEVSEGVEVVAVIKKASADNSDLAEGKCMPL